MIKAHGLTKYFGARKALDGLSLQIAEGETVGLVGKNGAGKSTVLRILSCQLLPTQGEVAVDGLGVVDAPEQVRRRIGFLPERPPMYPEMSVQRYLIFAARLRGVSAAAAPQAVAGVMERTGLTEVAAERLGNLSRGYQQRAGIAQAIVHDPKVVLLDEPMAGLDPLQITQMRTLVRDLKPRHTVLFSSHILSEITNVCDRVILIDQGRVRAEGSERQLWETFHQRERLVLRVHGAQPAARTAVAQAPGVEVRGATEHGDGSLSLALTAPAESRAALAAAVVGAGLGLLELRQEQHGLEELFVELLTAREAS